MNYFSTNTHILRSLYSFSITVFKLVLDVLQFFSPKLKLGVQGRKQTFKQLRAIPKNSSTIWFHCSSLGEFEQGLPVFKAVKKTYPEAFIVLSFFSPSGYTAKQQTPIADLVVYLPIDTRANAKRFVSIVNPMLSVFVKYDIWPNYLQALQQHNGNAILISAVFRPKQIYFKWYGGLFKTALKGFNYIFVQDSNSQQLLSQYGISSTVSGDTRFDRVYQQLSVNNTLPAIKQFKANSLCVVAGSTWPEDDALLIAHINAHPSEDNTFIIAPHRIQPAYLKKLQNKLNVQSVLYSKQTEKDLQQSKVLIIDNIGMLSKIYAYSDIAYIGGAMGNTGLHNTLEAAVFGVPILIGQHFSRFPEAIDMIEFGGIKSISNINDFNSILLKWYKNKSLREQLGTLNKTYVNQRKGATEKIMQYLNTLHLT